MKKYLNSLALMSMIAGSIFITNPVKADSPPPPAAHGSEGNQDPKGAPIDGGLGILLALGAGYGGLKLYKNRKKAQEENTES